VTILSRYRLVVIWTGPGWYGEQYYNGGLYWSLIHDDKTNEPDRLDDERYAMFVKVEWLDEPPIWADEVQACWNVAPADQWTKA
jgi:hypothetical protein